MRLFYCLLIFLCPLVGVAQTPALKPLAIGDKVPDLNFSKILNAPYSAISLATFSDKLILLDFWATWCSACIREFPKLDSLQERYKEQLQVLLVNNFKSGDDEKKIAAFFAKRQSAGSLKYMLPVILDSGMLDQLFPHKTIPHTIWIYKGEILAISNAEEVTAANIKAVFENKPLQIVFKSEQLDFDAHQPLLQNNNGGGLEMLLSRSLFTRYIDGIWNSIGVSLDLKGFKRLYLIDQPLLRMYAIAYTDIPANRVVIDPLISKELINTDIDKEWKSDHFYCYELTMPSTTTLAEMHNRMRKDLDAQFGFNSRIEKRTIDCFALIILPSSESTFKSGNTHFSKSLPDEKYVRLSGQPLSILLEQINEQVPGTPIKSVVLDETGYSGKATLEIATKDMAAIPALQQALRPYGLDIVPCKRELLMLVITKSIF